MYTHKNIARKVFATAFLIAGSNAAVEAVEINVNKMDFYPIGATSPAVVDNQVTGSVNFTTQTGVFRSGPAGFFGTQWTATVQEAWEAPGTYTFAGTVPDDGQFSVSPGTAFSYTFTLAANQYAAGVYFDWGTNKNIPVLAAFDCVTGSTTLIPLDTEADGTPGTDMQTDPFPGQTAAFSGALAAGVCLGATANTPTITNDGGATYSAGSLDPAGDGILTLSELISAGVPMDNDTVEQCVGGCLDFQVSGLGGNTIAILFPLTAPMPAAPVYRKWNGSAWVDFVVNANNTIESAEGSLGTCPTSGYSAGLQKGHHCIKLTIEDNGPNDDNPAVGVVADPGGVGEQVIPAASSSPGGCMVSASQPSLAKHVDWLLIAGFLAAVGWLRRRTPHF